MSTIAERVARGAGWLDSALPGWHREIDLNRLILSSPCRCVLGQLWGDYADSPLVDEHGDQAGVDRGFYAGGEDGRVGPLTEFAELQVEWRRVITERRAAA